MQLKTFMNSTLIAAGAFALALATACGGGSGDDIQGTPDSGINLPADAATATMCQTAEQTGCPDNLPKCTVQIGADNKTWSTVCRALTGDPPGTLDMACARESDGNAGVGRDTCDKGLYCTARGNHDGSIGPGHQTCRQYCRATSSCTNGHECMVLTDLTPKDGTCIDSCTPLGTDVCDQAMAWCDPTDNIQGSTRGICTLKGTLAIGATCDGATITDSCVANSLCVVSTDASGNKTSRCDSACDLAGIDHPCTVAGETCTAFSSGGSADYGFCSPGSARRVKTSQRRPPPYDAEL